MSDALASGERRPDVFYRPPHTGATMNHGPPVDARRAVNE
ncbi:hypothetical protein SAOR_03030 [Salinisphaera orenii MK-B5]|uniref:Uncharacterized protein n=1 Tax=Salinisphaera orenii MK-B5 TaxID=856730 RepID=A0A423PW14_9GAMM|nr:hypothetical protein SAOR_03030 [Salinisphaera orenii MK-B5]